MTLRSGADQSQGIGLLGGLGCEANPHCYLGSCLSMSNTGCEVGESFIALPGPAGRLLEADMAGRDHSSDRYVSAGCEVAESIVAEADALGRVDSTDKPCDQSRWDRYTRCGGSD